MEEERNGSALYCKADFTTSYDEHSGFSDKVNASVTRSSQHATRYGVKENSKKVQIF
jgi:hypothetical protein